MAHPDIQNRTPFVVEPLFVADEEGRPIVAPIVKATLDVSAQGEVSVAEEQAPVNFTGEACGEPGESSYRFEPETAFIKLGTDVVMVGHAHAPFRGASEVEVTLQVGFLNKTIRVVGDRHVEAGVQFGFSRPAPFEKIPLTWERAFGGWDRSPEDPDDHTFEPRNPVGVGFVGAKGRIYEGSPLPNLEDPRDPLTAVGGKCKPVGFGFTSPNWEPRRLLAGTYDEKWSQTRAPLLPKDFDRWFFNAGSEGLVSQQYLTGGEWVQVYNATPEGKWAFQLPGFHFPLCKAVTKWGEERELTAALDTLVVDADSMQVQMIWRCCTELRDGPLDLAALEVTCENAPEPVETVPAGADAGSTE